MAESIQGHHLSVSIDAARLARRRGFQLLRDFAQRMVPDFTSVLRGTTKVGGATARVEPATSELLAKYDAVENVDKVISLQDEVSKVKRQFGENINQQMANMESADELESRSLLMRDQASDFKAGSAKLRKKMWWKNCKVRMRSCFEWGTVTPSLADRPPCLRFTSSTLAYFWLW
jgi:hypothetical protein